MEPIAKAAIKVKDMTKPLSHDPSSLLLRMPLQHKSVTTNEETINVATSELGQPTQHITSTPVPTDNSHLHFICPQRDILITKKINGTCSISSLILPYVHL